MHHQEQRGRPWTRQLPGSISSRTSDAWSPHQPDGTADGSYSDRTSDDHQPPDDQQRPEIRRWLSRAKTPDVRQVPDDRTLVSHRTSGTRRTFDDCLCTVYRAEPMYPFALTYDRGKGVPSFDEMMDIALVEVDFDDPTTDVRGRRTLAIAKPTSRDYDHAGARST